MGPTRLSFSCSCVSRVDCGDLETLPSKLRSLWISFGAFSEEREVLSLFEGIVITVYHAVYFSLVPELPPTWNYLVDKTGVGRQVVFPVLMKPMLHWSKENYRKDEAGNIVKVDNRMPLERVFLRDTCVGLASCPVGSVHVHSKLYNLQRLGRNCSRFRSQVSEPA